MDCVFAGGKNAPPRSLIVICGKEECSQAAIIVSVAHLFIQAKQIK